MVFESCFLWGGKAESERHIQTVHHDQPNCCPGFLLLFVLFVFFGGGTFDSGPTLADFKLLICVQPHLPQN